MRNTKDNTKHEHVCVGGKANNDADDNTYHLGARMVFLIMHSVDTLQELGMLMMITTHLSRNFMKR